MNKTITKQDKKSFSSRGREKTQYRVELTTSFQWQSLNPFHEGDKIVTTTNYFSKACAVPEILLALLVAHIYKNV